MDGIERVLGERQPGDVFGEVPIVLGTVFSEMQARAKPSLEAKPRHREAPLLGVFVAVQGPAH